MQERCFPHYDHSLLLLHTSTISCSLEQPSEWPKQSSALATSPVSEASNTPTTTSLQPSPKPRPIRPKLISITEHFSTPLHFAQQHFSLNAELIPVPTGTGDLTKRLKTSDESQRLDVAIGLTEGFVADLGKSRAAGESASYGLVGTYVDSPLRWAISTGKEREDVKDVEGLKGSRVGVSRIGR
jgi:hypothetical protein